MSPVLVITWNYLMAYQIQTGTKLKYFNKTQTSSRRSLFLLFGMHNLQTFKISTTFKLCLVNGKVLKLLNVITQNIQPAATIRT